MSLYGGMAGILDNITEETDHDIEEVRFLTQTSVLYGLCVCVWFVGRSCLFYRTGPAGRYGSVQWML